MGVRGKSLFRDYILILIGASIMGFAIKNIYDPIGLVTGGASGVAIILKKQFGVPLWLTNTAINIPLFAAAAKLKAGALSSGRFWLRSRCRFPFM